MAINTFTFDIDATFRMAFVNDDVAGTTNVQVIRKSDGVTVATITLTQFETMVGNYTVWNVNRQTPRLLAFTKV